MSLHGQFNAGRNCMLHFAHLGRCVGFVLAGCLFTAIPASAQESPPPAGDVAGAEKPETPAASDELSVAQARLADRFKRLEEVVGRLAELSASTDPRRAKLLRDAVAQSREQDINVRFESIVKLLEDERLSAAAKNQTELQQELDELLSLLLKADRDKELSSQRERVRRYLKELQGLIRLQRGIRARTEGGDELPQLGQDQQNVADNTGKLGADIVENEVDKNHSRADDKAGNSDNGDKTGEKPLGGEKQSGNEKPNDSQNKPDEGRDDSDKDSNSDGPAESGESKQSDAQDGDSSESKPGDSKPSDGKPAESQQQNQPGTPSENGGEANGNSQQQPQPEQPQDPAERASKRLRDAQKKMEDALDKLKDAERKGAADEQREALKALEQAKADLERVLRQLREEEMERTLTQLAARFRKMLELQIQVYDGTVRLDRVPEAKRDHDNEIEAARLSRQESQIVGEADKALLLLHEEGSSVAFPEAVEQMRGDMRQIAERLGEVKVDAITQGLEQDVIAALEETIASLEKAIKDLEKKKTPMGQPRAAGEPTEPPLVDKLAELKMIRSLQMRINIRTERYGQMIEGEQAETDELLDALKDLAGRQQRVHQAAADLARGRND